jgi:hypothetical protein
MTSIYTTAWTATVKHTVDVPHTHDDSASPAEPSARSVPTKRIALVAVATTTSGDVDILRRTSLETRHASTAPAHAITRVQIKERAIANAAADFGSHGKKMLAAAAERRAHLASIAPLSPREDTK